jgi:tetratricopeptide (TPR) repeat protein
VVTIGALGLSLVACGGAGKSSSTASADYATLVDAGTHLLNEGNASAAAQLFEKAIAKDPAAPVGHYDLGVVYEHRGQTKNAMREYSRALAADPNYVPALYNKASILRSSRPLVAIFYYQKVVSLRPKAATALLNLGLLLTAQPGSRAVGLRALAKAIRLQPSLRSDLPAPLQAVVSARKTG